MLYEERLRQFNLFPLERLSVLTDLNLACKIFTGVIDLSWSAHPELR